MRTTYPIEQNNLPHQRAQFRSSRQFNEEKKKNSEKNRKEDFYSQVSRALQHTGRSRGV